VAGKKQLANLTELVMTACRFVNVVLGTAHGVLVDEKLFQLLICCRFGTLTFVSRNKTEGAKVV
jgi:hypothetical protein